MSRISNPIYPNSLFIVDIANLNVPPIIVVIISIIANKPLKVVSSFNEDSSLNIRDSVNSCIFSITSYICCDVTGGNISRNDFETTFATLPIAVNILVTEPSNSSLPLGLPMSSISLLIGVPAFSASFANFLISSICSWV